jgi:hypothetical protein
MLVLGLALICTGISPVFATFFKILNTVGLV